MWPGARVQAKMGKGALSSSYEISWRRKGNPDAEGGKGWISKEMLALSACSRYCFRVLACRLRWDGHQAQPTVLVGSAKSPWRNIWLGGGQARSRGRSVSCSFAL